MAGLVDKVEERIVNGISDGEFPVGKPLPSRHELSLRLGIGERTVRAAIVRLAASGIVSVHRRIGAVVLKKNSKKRQCRFLDVRSEDFGSCAGSMFSLGVRRTVEKAGCRYREVQLSYCEDDGMDLEPLDEALEDKPDFVLIRAPNCRLQEIACFVSKRGVPYATVANAAFSQGKCVGAVRYDSSQPVREFVRDCKRAGVRSVLQFDFGGDSIVDARKPLERAGISVERLATPKGSNYENLDVLVRDAALVMKRRLAKCSLPDLVLITDDFLASGAISTLYQEGFRIPKDVRVVAYANRGSGFPFLQTMACFESDPRVEGANCAKSALKYLKTGHFPPYVISSVYRRGCSFPVY